MSQLPDVYIGQGKAEFVRGILQQVASRKVMWKSGCGMVMLGFLSAHLGMMA